MKLKESHKLRAPTGPYLVGARYAEYTYTPEHSSAERIVPCVLFYPAQDKGTGTLKPYVSLKVLPDSGGIEGNAYLNAPLATGAHPLLIFNHGFSVNYEANSVQCEELASHGYIVVGVGHVGDGTYELASGELSAFDMETMMREYQADAQAGTDMFPQYERWQRREGKGAGAEAHAVYYQRLIEVQPKMVEHTHIWVEDSMAVLHQVLAANSTPNSGWYGRINPDQIGAFGMSYGGSTAYSLLYASPHVKAAANLDGFYYSDIWQTPLPKPMLAMHHGAIGGLFLTYPFLNAGNDAYLATFHETTHGNFCDYNEIMEGNPIYKGVIAGEEVEVALLGRVDLQVTQDLINLLLVEFFNKYLLGQPAPRLLDNPKVPEEMVLERKRN